MPDRDHPSILRRAACAVCAAVLCVSDRADVFPSTAPTTSPAIIKPSTAPLFSPTFPATMPATEPSVSKSRQAMSLPKKYDMLMTRSIFAHKRGPGPGGDVAAAAQPVKPGVVLRGVADQGGQRTALLEDTANGKTRQLHVGDEASGGRIIAITMEGLDRSINGSVLHLGIGQSLDGDAGTAGATTRQSIALESRLPGPIEPTPGSAIPAAATILETPR